MGIGAAALSWGPSFVQQQTRTRREKEQGNTLPAVSRRPSRRSPLTDHPHGVTSCPTLGARPRCIDGNPTATCSTVEAVVRSLVSRTCRPAVSQKQFPAKGPRRRPGLVPAIALPHPPRRRDPQPGLLPAPAATAVRGPSLEPHQLDPENASASIRNPQGTPSVHAASAARPRLAHCA